MPIQHKHKHFGHHHSTARASRGAPDQPLRAPIAGSNLNSRNMSRRSSHLHLRPSDVPWNTRAIPVGAAGAHQESDRLSMEPVRLRDPYGNEHIRVGKHRFPIFSHPFFRQQVESNVKVMKTVEQVMENNPQLQQMMEEMVDYLLWKGQEGVAMEEVETMLESHIPELDIFLPAPPPPPPLILSSDVPSQSLGSTVPPNSTQDRGAENFYASDEYPLHANTLSVDSMQHGAPFVLVTAAPSGALSPVLLSKEELLAHQQQSFSLKMPSGSSVSLGKEPSQTLSSPPLSRPMSSIAPQSGMGVGFNTPHEAFSRRGSEVVDPPPGGHTRHTFRGTVSITEPREVSSGHHPNSAGRMDTASLSTENSSPKSETSAFPMEKSKTDAGILKKESILQPAYRSFASEGPATGEIDGVEKGSHHQTADPMLSGTEVSRGVAVDSKPEDLESAKLLMETDNRSTSKSLSSAFSHWKGSVTCGGTTALPSPDNYSTATTQPGHSGARLSNPTFLTAGGANTALPPIGSLQADVGTHSDDLGGAPKQRFFSMGSFCSSVKRYTENSSPNLHSSSSGKERINGQTDSSPLQLSDPKIESAPFRSEEWLSGSEGSLTTHNVNVTSSSPPLPFIPVTPRPKEVLPTLLSSSELVRDYTSVGTKSPRSPVERFNATRSGISYGGDRHSTHPRPMVVRPPPPLPKYRMNGHGVGLDSPGCSGELETSSPGSLGSEANAPTGAAYQFVPRLRTWPPDQRPAKRLPFRPSDPPRCRAVPKPPVTKHSKVVHQLEPVGFSMKELCKSMRSRDSGSAGMSSSLGSAAWSAPSSIDGKNPGNVSSSTPTPTCFLTQSFALDPELLSDYKGGQGNANQNFIVNVQSKTATRKQHPTFNSSQSTSSFCPAPLPSNFGFPLVYPDLNVWRQAVRTAVYSLLHRRLEISEADGTCISSSYVPFSEIRNERGMQVIHSLDAIVLEEMHPQHYGCLDIGMDGNSSLIHVRPKPSQETARLPSQISKRILHAQAKTEVGRRIPQSSALGVAAFTAVKHPWTSKRVQDCFASFQREVGSTALPQHIDWNGTRLAQVEGAAVGGAEKAWGMTSTSSFHSRGGPNRKGKDGISNNFGVWFTHADIYDRAKDTVENQLPLKP